MDMDFGEDSSRSCSLRATTLSKMSSSSSAFFSANQSPFFSPRSPSCQTLSESTRSEARCDSIGLSTDPLSSSSGLPDLESLTNVRYALANMAAAPVASVSGDYQKFDRTSLSTGISDSILSSHNHAQVHDYSGFGEKQKRHARSYGSSYTPGPFSVTYNRLRSCDVFIGLHGRKPSLLRFVNWLQAELEVQGMSCFVSDRSKCRNSRKHAIVEKAMDVSSYGIVILTKKSFSNPWTIEELRYFSSKKNLVPIFFDLSHGDCLVRDIVERRGELWENNGGDLWLLYGGLEKEWKEAVHSLSRVDEWKLEAQDGNWRDCILRAVTLLAIRLGRRSVIDRLTKWREQVEKDEFPLPRNENFIGRKKELTELEFILFGDVSGEAERDYFELKARPRRKNLTIGWGKSSSYEERRRERKSEFNGRKGKGPAVWKESEKEIEVQSSDLPQRQHHQSKHKSSGRNARRKRSTKVVYGKGIACVSGDSGIGKTELLLEFAYRHHQRYKMVLWIGGESRYIRQNYLNLWSFLEVDVGAENCTDKNRFKSFEEQEEAAISRVRRELMRNIPFLVVIDNLESEKDWWDHKLVMDLLPRFGGETHIIISTRLPSLMNLEPLKLPYLSEAEALTLMKGSEREYTSTEEDDLRSIEEKLGRSTLGLAIVGSILSELPITPCKLLETTSRMPFKDWSWSGRETQSLRRNTFLLQLFEVCFSIFDHADGPRSLATRMVQASSWFAPTAVPVYLLAQAAQKIPEKHQVTLLWQRLVQTFNCRCTSSYTKKSEAEATSMLLRFNIARSSTKPDHVHIHELVKLYAHRRGIIGVPQTVVQAVISHGSIIQHSEHIWAACFLIFGFSHDIKVVDIRVSDLLFLVKEVVLPLAIRTFITFSRCKAALELLRLCTNALEAAGEALQAPVDKWVVKSLCWRPIQTSAQLNPYLWHEVALTRATLLETRARLMLRGGQFDIADDLIRKAIFIRSSISGEDHPDTVAASETLAKITRLLAVVQIHSSP